MASPLDTFLLPSEVIRDGRIFHMAMAVPDLERAMESLGTALRLDWTEVRHVQMELVQPDGNVTTRIRAVYSKQGPPYLELVSGEPGSMFSAADGPRLHHAGMIVEDVAEETKRLQWLGMTLIAQTTSGVAFMTNEFGLHLELLNEQVRGTLDNWLGGAGR